MSTARRCIDFWLEYLRVAILQLYIWAGWIDGLHARLLFTEVGFSGHVSLMDQAHAAEQSLKSLTRFERWWLAPVIEVERERRRDAWRQSCIEVLGEDPEDW